MEKRAAVHVTRSQLAMLAADFGDCGWNTLKTKRDAGIIEDKLMLRKWKVSYA